VRSGRARYSGDATLILSGTFTMGHNGKELCAVIPGSWSCDLSAATACDPNVNDLVVVADGDDGTGTGISLKGSTFQGGLVANKASAPTRTRRSSARW
jgi:hypothetical protein